MQKPKFRTVEKSAWVFITNTLHPTKARKIDRRTARRCGYLTSASALLNTESVLSTPHRGEPMREYRKRARSA